MDQLVTDLAGGVPGPVLRSLISSAAGNPLYISELVGGLAREKRLRAADDVVDVEPDPNLRRMSPTLGMAIARRLAFLSGQTRELLQVAALLGAEFSVADVAAVLDRPVTDLLGPVREATAASLLAEQADQLAFRHPLVRTALDDELPMSARQALHLQIAQTLTTRASPPRVAEHMLAAGPAAAALLPWLAGATEDLATRTPVLAAELLGQVLDTLTPPPEIADLLRAGLAASLLRTGNARQAEQVARSALSVPSGPRTEAALRWTLANACASQGAADRTVEEIGIALATGRLTVAEQARFHGLAARSYITLSQAADAATSWQQSIAAAQASGDTMALAHGTQAASGARTWDGWLDEALTYADASVTATEALGARAGAQLAPYLQRGFCLAELDRDSEADKAFEDALRRAERGAGTDYLAWLYTCTARLRFAQGRWDEALAEIQAGLDLPDPFDMGRHLRGVAALIAVHRRDRATLASLLPFLKAPLPAANPGRQSANVPTWALALAAHAEGRTAEAAAILGPMWDEDVDRDHLRYLRHYLVPDLVAITLAAGDPAAAQRIGRSIERYASRRSAPALGRSAQHAQALANGDAAGLVQVAGDYQRAGRLLFAAQAREQAAPLLAEAGMVPQARDAIVGALAGYELMEARWDVGRAETLLRTFGGRRGVRGPRRRPKAGWDSLTEAERVVAGLVAEGLSNPAVAARLYLSRRTVQGHVSSILGKLGITSRVELATMVMRHEATRV
ncbi:MAG TPA: LuxR C-terminal-related transcriptional regulator [Streptosporangiaceae bacterium]|nr:LuxR C-terminal-related transcriptional regulator [Streptosporangiaceae bacterium]